MFEKTSYKQCRNGHVQRLSDKIARTKTITQGSTKHAEQQDLTDIEKKL